MFLKILIWFNLESGIFNKFISPLTAKCKLILEGNETRARMDAEVATMGHGYNGNIQIIHSMTTGFIFAVILLAVLLILNPILKKEKNL